MIPSVPSVPCLQLLVIWSRDFEEFRFLTSKSILTLNRISQFTSFSCGTHVVPLAFYFRSRLWSLLRTFGLRRLWTNPSIRTFTGFGIAQFDLVHGDQFPSQEFKAHEQLLKQLNQRSTLSEKCRDFIYLTVCHFCTYVPKEMRDLRYPEKSLAFAFINLWKSWDIPQVHSSCIGRAVVHSSSWSKLQRGKFTWL